MTTKIAQSVTGFDIQSPPAGSTTVCGTCIEGKQSREKLTGERKKCDEVLHTIHSDICGPMAVEGIMGERYFATFIDEGSGRMAIALLKQKSELFARFRDYQAKVETETGKKIKQLRSDGGAEYTGHDFRKYLAEKGVTQQITPPYTPEHNGIAERANRTIVDMVRCMLYDAKLGQEFWGHAALTAIHIINRLPSSAHNNKTPYEIWFGTPPSLGHLRVFGCTAYRHTPAQTRRKLDRHTEKCRLIGYVEESGSRVYRVYNEASKQVSTTRDVVFEEVAGEPLRQNSLSAEIGEEMDTEEDEDIHTPTPIQEHLTSPSNTTATQADQPKIGSPLPPIDPEEDQNMEGTYDLDTIVVRKPAASSYPNRELHSAAVSLPTNRRSQRVHEQRDLFGLGAWPAYLAVTEEPATLKAALAGEDAAAWRAAWESQLDSLRRNGTWVVDKVPEKGTVVGCRWLFRRKEDGRFKVRLVAKGYSQEPGLDFKETFAPVAKFTTLRVLLALVAENDWELHSMNVKMAFLNGELEEEIFMEIPEGVEEIANPGYAYRLIKAIYGLRQSPPAWYEKIHSFFIHHDFYLSSQDYSLYINYDKRILVLIYVDDLVLAAAEREDIGWIKNCLAKAFEMTDLGELSTFLGLEITRDRSKGLLTLGQHQYIDRILQRHGMQDARPCLTPLAPNTRLPATTEPDPTPTTNKEVSLELYQSAVGSLMYAMLGTRPDLAYAVGLVSQFNHSPKWEHWVAVKRIFRYLVGTKGYTLEYGSSNASGGYSDADWGSGHDRKSVGGFLFLLNRGAISWASKKQTSIALSTTEAEYMGMTQAAKEIVWLRALLDEIGAFRHIHQMSVLNGDNQGAIALARNPEYHACTKHIDIQYHFIRDLVSSEKVNLQFCSSTDMIADIMTKALPRATHDKHTQAMGLTGKTGYGTLREGAC